MLVSQPAAYKNFCTRSTRTVHLPVRVVRISLSNRSRRGVAFTVSQLANLGDSRITLLLKQHQLLPVYVISVVLRLSEANCGSWNRDSMV